MWSKSYSVVTNKVTQSQMWKLFSDVNNWHHWDEGIEYAKLSGEFEMGNVIALKPKGAPEVKVELLEVIPFKSFLDVTQFPLAKMYDSHSFEETPEGLRITDTITVKGLLSFLWVKLVASKIVAGLPVEMKKQIEWAKNL